MVQKFWLLVAAFIVSLALLVQAGRILSPQISDYKPQISSWLSKQLGVPVQMQHISLHWQALETTLQIDGLKLGKNGEVSLGRGLFHLDLLASLWHRELVWKNLEIDNFNAELVRTSKAQWHIKGFAHGSVDSDSTVASESGLHLSDPARIFQLSPKIQVHNANIGLQLNGDQKAGLNLQQILLENSNGFHRLTARAAVSERAMSPDFKEEETLSLVLEGHGKPRKPETFRLRGYLQFNELLISEDLVALINELSPLPEKYFWANSKRANGRLWLENSPQRGYQLHGQLTLAQAANGKNYKQAGVLSGPLNLVQTQANKSSVDTSKPLVATADASVMAELEQLSVNILGRWQPDGNWQLILEDTKLQWGKLKITPFDLQLTGKLKDEISLALGQIDLAAWQHVLNQLQVLPPKAAEWLKALEPSGSLQNIHFTYGVNGVVRLRANLRAVAAKAFSQAPMVSGVNGYLQLNRNSGWVQLNSNTGFVAHFPKLYVKPFEFKQAKGTVAWEIDSANNSVAVFSGPLQLNGVLGQVGGQFLLQLPRVAQSKPSEFTLALGLKDAAVTTQSVLIPNVVSGNLRAWLSQSLGQKNTGRIDTAGFIYRGYSYSSKVHNKKNAALLRLGEQAQRFTVQTRAKISSAELDYAPGWPQARDIAGQLYINDSQVTVNARKAKLWSVDAKQVAVTVSPQGEGLKLDVHAKLRGPAADGLKLLRQSPLREQLGSAFDNWELDGKMRGELTLTQPLGGAKLSARQNVDLQLSDARLGLKKLQLEVDKLSGLLHYDSQSGLEGSAFKGSLWGFPLNAKLQHTGKGSQRDTEVIIEGQSSAAALQLWSRVPELNWLDGEFNYITRITIPARAKHKPYMAMLETETDLHNVAVNLPAPLGKTPEQKTRFVLQVPITDESNLYHIRYGVHLQGQILQRNGKLQRVGIGLNTAPKLPQKNGVAIVGTLPQIDITQWRNALTIYTAESTNQARADQPEVDRHLSSQMALPISLNIRTNQLLLGATTIDNFHLRGTGSGADWQLRFDSETVAGELRGVFNTTRPLKLNLTYLKLPALPEVSKKNNDATPRSDQALKLDAWRGFDFTRLPLSDLSIKSLQFGDEDFGSWSFLLQPSAKQLLVNDINGTFRGITIEGTDENKKGAQLVWFRDVTGAETSHFSGRLQGGNLGQVLQAWGEAPILESKSATFNTAFHWQGSPSQARINTLSGSIDIDIKKGRFLRAKDDAGTALLRILSIFNFDTWARRLRLDFSDLVQSGLTFDRVRGEILFDGDGKLSIVDPNPIRVDSPSSKLQMVGQVDLKREDSNLTLIVTLPVGNNLALVAGLAGGLPAAAGVYLISKVFKKQVDKVASVSYRVSGDLSDPQVRFESFFDDSTNNQKPRIPEKTD
ncbi:MAG: DUF3971 domain-containing protein [Gammaproteobacteria bacterium]|nr:DUF3971 domain-containing protein [Gammaproteobacteria bacterium]